PPPPGRSGAPRKLWRPRVHLPRASPADLALADVARDRVAVAILGRAVAAAAAGAVADDVAGLHLDRHLRVELGLDAVADQHVFGRPPVVTAEHAPRAAHRPVGEHCERRRTVEEEVLA